MVLKEEMINQNCGTFAGRIAKLKRREKDAFVVLAISRGNFTNFPVFFTNDMDVVDKFRVGEYVQINGRVKTGFIPRPHREGEDKFYFQKFIATDIRRPQSRLKKLGLNSQSEQALEADENRILLSGKVTYLNRVKTGGYDLVRIRIEEEADEVTGRRKYQAPAILFYKEKKKWLDEIKEGDHICVQAEIQTSIEQNRKIARIVCNDMAVL